MTPDELAESRADLTLNKDAADSSAHARACAVGLSLLDYIDTLTAERNTLLDRVDRMTAALAREQKERRAEVDTITAELDEARRDAAYWTTIRDYVVRVDAVARPGGRMGDDDIASVVMQVLRRRAADAAYLTTDTVPGASPTE